MMIAGRMEMVTDPTIFVAGLTDEMVKKTDEWATAWSEMQTIVKNGKKQGKSS